MSGAGTTGKRWVVSGRVQGVGFRWFVQRKGDALGIEGWVRNLPDGRVEVAAAGPPAALEAMGAALEAGPRLSRVDSVETYEYQHEATQGKSFQVR